MNSKNFNLSRILKNAGSYCGVLRNSHFPSFLLVIGTYYLCKNKTTASQLFEIPVTAQMNCLYILLALFNVNFKASNNGINLCIFYPFAEEDYDAFCLAYMFTYRDFEMGTLGLAWTGDLKNAGGVCEKNGVSFSFIFRRTPLNCKIFV